MVFKRSESIFSPRMWRCFPLIPNQIVGTKIFSTYVEVFPGLKLILRLCRYFLHVCGGVSSLDNDDIVGL